MDVRELQRRLGVDDDGAFGPASRAALFARLSNPAPAPLTDADFVRVAADLGVAVQTIRAVREVEAPRGAFDSEGRPATLYERHVFARNTTPHGRFNLSNPALSGGPYGAGGYGPYSAQYTKLAAACALDPDAAFKACSWGAFQVLGEGAEAMGYASAFDLAIELTTGEAAHLDSFARFVRWKKADDELRQCKAGDAASCIPFVTIYNGIRFREFNYHVKFAAAML